MSINLVAILVLLAAAIAMFAINRPRMDVVTLMIGDRLVRSGVLITALLGMFIANTATAW
jgi:hypothetical protein